MRFTDFLGLGAKDNVESEEEQERKRQEEAKKKKAQEQEQEQSQDKKKKKQEQSQGQDQEKKKKKDNNDDNLIEQSLEFFSSNAYYFSISFAGLLPENYQATNLIRTGSKYGGNIGTVASVVVNTKDVVEGDISPTRYSWRMIATGLTTVAGTLGTSGLGLLVGATAIGAEHVYDNVLVPMWGEVKNQYHVFENGLNNPSYWYKK